MIDLHDKILARLNSMYPELSVYIQQCMDAYGRVGDFLTGPRGEWLKEHKDKLRLRYR